ncbi:putative glutathione-regulated potassium-efflux system protein [gamma proteobacterium IMCC1989]|nr:putative glutathione-regulated potassium-efflux system protein [gamma proteobacterium IMCC1989]
MDFLWVCIAFGCGFLAKQVHLPPLIGYLAAGFGLHAIGVESSPTLATLGDIGVMLLLFTIGLKLNVHSLFKPEVWAGATGHMSIIVILTMINCTILSVLGVMYFTDLDLAGAALVGFAVSFSSTVIAVKVLEEKGEMRSRHGQVAIGILVIQDIAAVIFVTLASSISLSWWTLGLIALPFIRPLLYFMLERSGHGELLPLSGIFLAFAGGELFEWLGLKAHLGALVVAILLSSHAKAAELSKSLLNFKDIFLIGFFLSIGFTALPTFDMLGVALIMSVALPFKAGLFFLWLTRLKLRARTAFLTSLSLANYSEFGLIVCAISVTQGLLSKEWLVIMALSVSISFVFSSVINTWGHNLYRRWNKQIKQFETTQRLAEDQIAELGEATIVVVGMGRVGRGAYDALIEETQELICGIEMDRGRVNSLCENGRNVIFGDAEDPEFWSSISLKKVQLIMFAMPNYLDILEAQKQLNHYNFTGRTAGVAKYEDEKIALLEGGVDEVFNFYAEVGNGFATQSLHLVSDQS